MLKHLRFMILPALALGVMVLGVSIAEAKGGGGGGHGGGGHGGGGHGGGGHGGGHGGGYHGGGYHGGGGGYHHGGGYYGGYRGYYPYYGSGFYFGVGGYPYYYGGGYYGGGYGSGYYDPGYGYNTDYYYAPSAAGYPPQGPPQDDAVPLTDADALFSVRVPASATIWVNGDKTSQTGAQREFITNGLTPGKSYTYEIRARWMQNGQEVDRVQKVKVQGGERRVVDFVAAPAPQ